MKGVIIILISCPECALQLSDKALACPHCGYPMQPNSVHVTKMKNTKKHKRLPNGFGQITEIKNKQLRNRFRASITIGKRSDGTCIKKILSPKGYFATYNEAYQALIEYNKNPYKMLTKSNTVKEVFEKWLDEYTAEHNSASYSRSMLSAWNYCSAVYDLPISEIRPQHIKYCMTNGEFEYRGQIKKPSPDIKARVKSMFNLLLDYALENSLVDKNYARTFNISKNIIEDIENERVPHLCFTDSEMEYMWNHIDRSMCVDAVLIQCYSGWRPQELGNILVENVDLENWTFTGGMKTKAGKNRKVPIHSRIRELVEFRYNEAKQLNSPYLFNVESIYGNNDLKLTYDKYRHRFDKMVSEFHFSDKHRPHDGRKQFITMAKKNNVDQFAIKYLVGHAISDITEKVYTERDFAWVCSEMEKIR